ncbi:sortase [Bifidobacterium animalis]|uniref:sortase n=1 Tax=Bifidobacterium animalis TaxID=28025 RepID=UPI001EE4D2EA|nr:sortase [Bifidobacterium animalis]
MRVLTVVLITAAVVVGATPFVLQWNTARGLSSQSRAVERRVLGWPYRRRRTASRTPRVQRAPRRERPADPGRGRRPLRERGRQLARHGQGRVRREPGRGVPVAARPRARRHGLRSSSEDQRGPADPPRHLGTGARSGAGHLYGSEPAGGRRFDAVGDHGHRGLVAAPMFTRLDEMKDGDYFYIDVMGEKLGTCRPHHGDRPDDTSQLHVVPGEDRVTLMTCTPTA